MYDSRRGRRVVLEAHIRHQVYEEGVALLPKSSMSFEKNPTEYKRCRFHVNIYTYIYINLFIYIFTLSIFSKLLSQNGPTQGHIG